MRFFFLIDFAGWIIDELQKRGWAQAEFARRAEISPSQVSRVLSGDAKPGPEFLQGTARAFGLPADAIMRRAGMLPDHGEVLPEARDWSARLMLLSPELRENVIAAVDNVIRLAEGLPARTRRSR